MRHALVRRNPANGRESVFVGRHAALIEGEPEVEGRVFKVLQRTAEVDVYLSGLKFSACDLHDHEHFINACASRVPLTYHLAHCVLS